MRDYEGLKAKHPYVFHLAESLQENFEVINLGCVRSTGNLDFAKFFFKTEIVYLNWIEDSKLKDAILFILFFALFKVFNKKVIWTHHNIQSHKKGGFINKMLLFILSSYADKIIFHTKESFSILKKKTTDKRCYYFFHPFFDEMVRRIGGEKKMYDILIWGNVRKSKGVDEFLTYLQEHDVLEKYNIKIIGKFQSQTHYEELRTAYNLDNIEIDNRFVSSDELDRLHQISKFIFFPYTGPSVLNSGALITSMPKQVVIIGPNKGAFKEMGELKFILNYNTFSDVLAYVGGEKQYSIDFNRIDEFIQKHSWSRFSRELSIELS